MSAECSTCGADIVYPEGTWPVGTCARCDAKQEAENWKRLALDMGEALRMIEGAMRFAEDQEWFDEDIRPLLARLDGLPAGKETA